MENNNKPLAEFNHPMLNSSSQHHYTLTTEL